VVTVLVAVGPDVDVGAGGGTTTVGLMIVVSVTVVGVVVVVDDAVDEVVVADTDWITPQATRPPASPVARVSSSGPAEPSDRTSNAVRSPLAG
jgi:hypothetical protein